MLEISSVASSVASVGLDKMDVASMQGKSLAADKFSAAMQNVLHMPAHNSAAETPSMVSNLMEVGNSSVQSVIDQVNRFNSSASTMSSREFTAAGMALTMDTAMVMFQLNAGMGMVHSAKSSVQTLFKNQ